MKKSVFISAPFFSPKQIKKVKKVEKALAKNPTVKSYYSPRLHQSGDGYPEFSYKWCRATYHHDLDNALNADVIIEILDFDGQDTDSGTAYEYGYAKAYRKFITTISFDHHKQNLMLGIPTDHHFTNAEQVKHYDFEKLERNKFNGQMH